MTTGGPRILQIPEGDNRERKVCPECGFIDYENPKVVVGSVVTSGERILLCRRAIEPRKGYWTIPAGYLELHESTEDGARREAQEEATATIEIDGVLAVYTIPRISQVQLIYRAHLVSDVAPGPESLVRQFREASESGDWRARTNPPEGL
jgi:ADP-ribose pyrophosphatase YjhB (NUDIX family)